MFRRFIGLVISVAVWATGPAAGQLPPEQALASLQPADGLQVELFAAEPMVINPTSMDVDHLGRVWVTEAVNYRRKNFGRPILRPEGDRIVILADTTGDGKADTSTVFYQGEDLYGPLGIAVVPVPKPDRQGEIGYKVFVCQSPDILLFEDLDGDGKADGPPKKFLTGFKGFDHDHGVHGIVVGPEGKLYFTVGDSGVDGLQSSDGQGRVWKSNNTDCRAGTVWRCDMDGKNLELIAHNFRNNYECCINSFGEIWLSDNDDDGHQQTRICFVMPGGDYGYHPRGPGQSHWHEEQPGIVHKVLRTGFGSPTGICFYEGNLLPEKYRGQLLHTDAGPRELRCFHIKPKGAGYELEKENLLISSDTWFRLSDVCVAPDGSVFVADWYDPGVGGHGMGDWTRGRVYRVTPKGHVGYKVPAVKVDTKEGLVDAIKSSCIAVRAMICEYLRQSIPQGGEPTKEGLDSFGTLAGILNGFIDVDGVIWHRTLWIAFGCQKPEDRMIEAAHQASKSNRAVGIRLLRDARFPTIEAITKGKIKFDPLKINAPSAAREWLILLRDFPADQVADYFWPYAWVYTQYSPLGNDRFYLSALNIACGTDPARRDEILADFDKHFPEWNDKVADLVWELRPKSVMPRLEKLLVDAKLTPAQRARIVDILAANDEPTTGAAMLKLLSSDAPAEVKARAIENLRQFLPGKWNQLVRGQELNATIDRLLADASGVTTGLQLAAAASFAPAVEAIEKIAADAGRPLDLRVEAVRTLGAVRCEPAVEALVRLGRPENALTAETVAALGRQLPGGPKASPGGDRAQEALQTVVLDAGANRDLRSAALQALAGSRPGTIWLNNLKRDGDMPPELVAEAGQLLRNSPFQAERNKALQLFPAGGKLDPKALPSPAELARRTGKPEVGKEVMARTLTNDVQCLKCHTINGVGGQIGPDLSLIGKKASKENLFESVLLPSKAIADQFLTWTIDTLDGQSITGLIVGEAENTVTVRDANGKDYVIPTADIDRRTKSPNSLMPDNLVAGLTEEEFIDLVEYMTTLKEEEPKP